jgi:hypothetical protein
LRKRGGRVARGAAAPRPRLGSCAIAVAERIKTTTAAARISVARGVMDDPSRYCSRLSPRRRVDPRFRIEADTWVGPYREVMKTRF